MFRKTDFFVVLALLAILLLGACTGVQAAEPQAQHFSLEAISHVAMGLPEQDVYIEQDPGSGQVVRILPDQADLYKDAPVYAATHLVEHDLFQSGESPLGPFEKGEALGMTLGEWISASGKGSYTLIGDQARINLRFENLVPGGVYTLWCSRVSFPPNINIVDEPCGQPDGSQNSFIADKKGRAQFKLDLPALPASSAETATVFALAYHSDGQTYGAYPGDFGFNSHVQIAAMLPQAQ
jgi:hypothetical protein